MNTPSDSEQDRTRLMEQSPDPTAVQPLADRPDGGVPGLRRPQRQRPGGAGIVIAVLVVLVTLGIVFALSVRGPSTDDGTDDIVESDETDTGGGGEAPGTTQTTANSDDADDSTTDSTDPQETSTTTESTSTTADNSSTTQEPTTTADVESDATATTASSDE